MFFFERKSESVDDGPKYLQQLSNAVESFGFVDELEEHVVDRPPYVGSEVQKLAVNPVQSRFEEISFAGILRVEQLQQLGSVSKRNQQPMYFTIPAGRTDDQCSLWQYSY